jgi:putative ABC transport system permease protein
MISAFGKDVLRSITNNLGRFIALLTIVGLGVGFYAGLRMTAPDMKASADQYYDSASTMDIRVASTMGLSASDIDAIAQVDGVKSVMPAYEADAIATLNGKQHTFRIHSLPEAATGEASRTSGDDSADRDTTYTGDVSQASAKGSYLNQLQLVEGRLPEKAGECVISADVVLETTPQIGDTVAIDSGTGDLDSTFATRTLTIVGTVHAPYYVESASLGTSTLGSGVVQEYLYVSESTFAADYPITEAFVTVTGACDLDSSSDAYQARIDEVTANINAIADAREEERQASLKAAAQKKVDDARAEYETAKADAESQLADALSQLESAQSQISSSESSLSSAQREYSSGVAELEQKRSQVEISFAEAEAQLSENQSEVDSGKLALEAAESEYAAGIAAWKQAKSEFDAKKQAYKQSGIQDPATEATLAAGKQQLREAKTTLDASAAQLEQQKSKLDAAQARIDSAREQLSATRESTNAQLEAAQQKLDSAERQLAIGYVQLADGESSYEQGMASYESSRAEVDGKFASTEQELADAQEEVDSIEHPDWLVMDRTKNVGLVSFTSDADRVDHIAQVFPFMFFLVAALVALTTMTRMVDEERVLIGTYKALGYSRGRIAGKYLGYAIIASGLGSVLGILLLGKTLPIIIMYAYAIIYYVPTGMLSFDPLIVALSAGLGVGITVAATAAAAMAQLRECPASLMQPRAPKAGKRILLERVPAIWGRLSFSRKVTARNIFRYKKRFLMTLVGIAGCAALMLTGWGLRDSINDIIDTQYGELIHYNASVTFADDASADDKDAVRAVVEDDSLVTASTIVDYRTMMLVDSEGSEHRIGLVSPSDSSEFASVWTLRDRLSHENAFFDDDSVVVTEKLATQLNVGVGDRITVAAQDLMGNAESDHRELVVTAIVENYLYDYVFVGKSAYESAFGEAPEFATWYASISDTDGARDMFDQRVSAIEGVKTLAYNDETIKTYRSMLKSVDFIVVILVIAAALLAYIVLYNLTNINIEERVREIATLKVLGFLPKETYAYIFREILITVALGCLVGLALGVPLESFIISSAEVDQAMFGRVIHSASFFISFAMTFGFAFLVLFLMRGRLARIDMVESLKSIE